jgi:hypothetical protein
MYLRLHDKSPISYLSVFDLDLDMLTSKSVLLLLDHDINQSLQCGARLGDLLCREQQELDNTDDQQDVSFTLGQHNHFGGAIKV